MSAIPTPICDLCGRPVEHFETEYCVHSHSVSMTARCHGDLENYIIPSREFLGLKAGILEARAFRQSGPRVVVQQRLRPASNMEQLKADMKIVDKMLSEQLDDYEIPDRDAE